MTSEEIQQLAEKIAALLSRTEWVPAPVRPDPPGRPSAGKLPPWAGAAQQLNDIAPGEGRKTGGPHRPSYDAITTAARAAAAGTGPSPLPHPHRADEGGSPGPGAGSGSRTVPIGISNRHIHITQSDFEKLFGAGKQLSPDRPITQPSQFAAMERIRVVGPKGAIDGVRIVGPARQTTQVELSSSDCRAIGVTAPVRISGKVTGSAAITLEGPAGLLQLSEGAIIAARHIHVSPVDSTRLGVGDGDRVTVELGPADRRASLHDVPVRSGSTHQTEMHLDTDEAHAFGLKDGDLATLIGRARKSDSSPAARNGRRLITERDVDQIAARGETLSYASPYRLTPSARDRARALGIWRDTR